jgi:tRNA U34 5-methylaminomethyl-2-thiouridine-forming methyltransferase MnmC
MSAGQKLPTDGVWTALTTGDGSITLAHPAHGETCHSRAGAWTQARERYARPCRIHERALELHGAGRSHLRLLDVGTGLGLNIAAALEAVEDVDIGLDITSLEVDPLVIAGAIAIGAQPLTELERFHAPVRAALERALEPSSKGLVDLGRHRLRLVSGDGRDSLAALDPHACFDAVFLDPFSPRVDPDLWEPCALRAIAVRMAPHSVLSTYSAAVRVRAGLRAAGLHVGPGPRVQEKAQGTLASPDPLTSTFDARTQRRLDARAREVTLQRTAPGGIPQGNGLPAVR